MANLFKIPELQALCNKREKFYPNFETGELVKVQTLIFSKPLFNPHHYERSGGIPKEADDLFEGTDFETDEGDLESALSDKKPYYRAKQKCFDYLMCNPDLNYFITLTFSPEMVDRYSYNDIINRLNVWLDHQVQRKGLKYVLVPEYHKDNAIHFHGLFNDALSYTFSGYYKVGKRKVPIEKSTSSDRKHGQKIYNVENFPYGFTTAISITGEKATVKVSKYLYKYMTKSQGKKIGGRYYLHSHNLAEPFYSYSNGVFDEFPDLTPQDVPSTSIKFVVQNVAL